ALTTDHDMESVVLGQALDPDLEALCSRQRGEIGSLILGAQLGGRRFERGRQRRHRLFGLRCRLVPSLAIRLMRKYDDGGLETLPVLERSEQRRRVRAPELLIEQNLLNLH